MILDYSRLRFGEEASAKLSNLKGKTGITPNLLARIGFCMSLNEPGIPRFEDYLPESERELDRSTLTGKWDPMFVALFLERCYQDEVDSDRYLDYFKAHMNRGVLLLDKQVKKLNDLAVLLPKAYRGLAVNGAMEVAEANE